MKIDEGLEYLLLCLMTREVIEELFKTGEPFEDAANLQRVVETFLGRVFCSFGIVLVFSHRASAHRKIMRP